MANSIRVDGLCAGYGSVQVLERISLAVNDGETVTLLGTNGNGKSTLMKCIMGIVPPTAGRINATIDGVEHDLVGRPPEQIVDLGIVLVPEGRRLFPRLTVEENLLLGAFRRSARGAIARNLEFCFETFPVLAERRRQLAGSMSGGEQQMLTLARALMTAPKILLIDEPSWPSRISTRRSASLTAAMLSCTAGSNTRVARARISPGTSSSTSSIWVCDGMKPDFVATD